MVVVLGKWSAENDIQDHEGRQHHGGQHPVIAQSAAVGVAPKRRTPILPDQRPRFFLERLGKEIRTDHQDPAAEDDEVERGHH